MQGLHGIDELDLWVVDLGQEASLKLLKCKVSPGCTPLWGSGRSCEFVRCCAIASTASAGETLDWCGLMHHGRNRTATLTPVASHVLPDGSLPMSQMKEELSKAYVHMVSSACGLSVGTWSQDFDCRDVTLSSSVDYNPHTYGPKIDIQLKCTGQASVDRTDTIAWSLDSRAYEKMSKLNRSNPALFCVLVAPTDVGSWLRYDQEGLLARSHMYWQWGHCLPAHKPGQDSQVIHLAKSNVLTPTSMIDLMEEAAKWTPSMTP